MVESADDVLDVLRVPVFYWKKEFDKKDVNYNYFYRICSWPVRRRRNRLTGHLLGKSHLIMQSSINYFLNNLVFSRFSSFKFYI